MRETTDGTLAVAPAKPFRRRLLRQRLPVILAAVLVLTVIGPFGTFQDLRPLPRLAYWGGLILAGFLAFELLVRIALRVARGDARRWGLVVGGAALGVTALETVVVAAVEWSVRGHDFFSPAGLLELALYVGTITVLVAAVPVLLELRERGLIGVVPSPPSPVPAAPSGPAGEPRLFARIPSRLGRDLLALAMEDHYVRVHTALGSDLILMRLRDAVAELDGVPGLQVHRSHWVAAHAVAAVERRPDGKMTLVLVNGLRVPVSRSYAAGVRAAGWLERA